MKKIIILISFFFFSGIYAQNKMHWRAVYQYKQIVTEKEKARRDSLIKAQPAMADMMKRMYKRFGNRTFYLDFNSEESVYKEKPQLSNSKTGFSFSTIGKNILYKNLKKKIYIKENPLFDKSYLVKDSLPDYHWKITGETKKIGNYTVIKAEGTEKIKKIDRSKRNDPNKKIHWKEENKKIIAWFTPELPISNGPSLYGGLPGLIMELDKDNQVYLLKELIINPTKSNDIAAPKKGKIVTQKEYDELRKKSFEKMRKMYKNRRGNKGRSSMSITL